MVGGDDHNKKIIKKYGIKIMELTRNHYIIIAVVVAVVVIIGIFLYKKEGYKLYNPPTAEQIEECRLQAEGHANVADKDPHANSDQVYFSTYNDCINRASGWVRDNEKKRVVKQQ